VHSGVQYDKKDKIMVRFRSLLQLSTIVAAAALLTGCVSESYDYDGYRNYGSGYDGYYSGSAVVYRSGPRYDRYDRYNRYDRYDRYNRQRDPRRRDRDNDRPGREGRPQVTPPRPQPEASSQSVRRGVVLREVDRIEPANPGQQPARILRRESHN
jgi:hypothetical protein